MKRESLTTEAQYAYRDRNYRRLGWILIAVGFVVYLIVLVGAVVIVVGSSPPVGMGALTVVIIMGWPSFALAAVVNIAVMMWHDAPEQTSRSTHSNGENR